MNERCSSDVEGYMEKMQVSFLAAAAEAAEYLPIGRCDCVLDENTKVPAPLSALALILIKLYYKTY